MTNNNETTKNTSTKEEIIEYWVIKEGVDAGKLQYDCVMELLPRLMADFIKNANQKCQSLNDLLYSSKADIAQYNRAFAAARDYLNKWGIVYTDRFITVDANGAKVDGRRKQTAEEASKNKQVHERYTIQDSDFFKKNMFELCEKIISKEFSIYTPTLEHKADAKRYLEILKELFPNALSAEKFAKGWRYFLENIHNACGTPNAKFTQKALWMLSEQTGETGKTYAQSRFKDACENLHLAVCENGIQKKWISPDVGTTTITIANDLPKMNEEMATTMNNLIDRDDFYYENKYGSAGWTKSTTTLMVSSNFQPIETNGRRYYVVEFLRQKLSTYPESIIKKYWPNWGNDEKVVELFEELLKVVPFQSELPKFPSAENMPKNNKLFNDTAESKTYVNAKYGDILLKIKEILAEYNDSEAFESKMYPTTFARIAVNSRLIDSTRTEFTDKVLWFLNELSSENLLKETGKTNLKNRLIDFKQFQNMEISVQDYSDFATDEFPELALTRREWDYLIENVPAIDCEEEDGQEELVEGEELVAERAGE